MTFAFDLISDLHVEAWGKLNWEHCATSPVCVVAGDIAQDRAVVVQTLKHLAACYQAVFYIDGNREHTPYQDNLSVSYRDLTKQIEKIPNVIYLQDNVVVIDGVAILGTNGWWAFDFDPSIEPQEAAEWFKQYFDFTDQRIANIMRMAITDSEYMVNSIQRLQTHKDVKKIVAVTHTVPDHTLIEHDIDFASSPVMNIMGNRHMLAAFDADTEKKLHTWVFGHYHGAVDQHINGVRFVNNCRGIPSGRYCQHVYYPKRIVVEL